MHDGPTHLHHAGTYRIHQTFLMSSLCLLECKKRLLRYNVLRYLVETVDSNAFYRRPEQPCDLQFRKRAAA